MLKFLLLFFLFFYVFFRLGGFLIRMLIGSTSNNRQGRNFESQQHTRKKPTDGNVYVDYVPDKKEENDKKDYEGGEYIDYEEVR